MKTLYSKKGYRGEGARQSFAFFIVGAVVVLVAVFLLGIYFGRELEKVGGPPSDNRVFKAAGEGPRAEWAVQGGGSGRVVDNVQRELGRFSEEAVRIPVVPPGRADAVPLPAEQDSALTFQESLSKKDAETVPVENPVVKPEPAGLKNGGVMIHAGAFKDAEKAEARLKKIVAGGYKAHLGRGGKGGTDGLYLVIAGPFPDRDAAGRAISKLKSEQKIDAVISR